MGLLEVIHHLAENDIRIFYRLPEKHLLHGEIGYTNHLDN
jgi:hypothetical protein